MSEILRREFEQAAWESVANILSVMHHIHKLKDLRYAALIAVDH